MGSGFHATNPQAAVFWNPANTATGSCRGCTYTLAGTFTLMKPSPHNNYYGLFFGGRELEGPQQNYTYFVIGQNGSWLVKRRAGDAKTENIAPRTPSDVVTRPDASGKSTNNLEVRVGADKIEYVVNGTIVHTAPKVGVNTDGIYGIRVNHQLEVHVEGLAVASSELVPRTKDAIRHD